MGKGLLHAGPAASAIGAEILNTRVRHSGAEASWDYGAGRLCVGHNPRHSLTEIQCIFWPDI